MNRSQSQFYEEWKVDRAENELKLTSLAAIDKAIHSAASKHHLMTIQNLDTSWAKLWALRSKLNPSDRERKLEIRAKWRELQSGPKGSQFEDWCDSFERTYERAELLQMPEAENEQATTDLLYAISNRDEDVITLDAGAGHPFLAPSPTTTPAPEEVILPN
jgi:hypothetical protein